MRPWDIDYQTFFSDPSWDIPAIDRFLAAGEERKRQIWQVRYAIK
jgi:hypothetical protein